MAPEVSWYAVSLNAEPAVKPLTFPALSVARTSNLYEWPGIRFSVTVAVVGLATRLKAPPSTLSMRLKFLIPLVASVPAHAIATGAPVLPRWPIRKVGAGALVIDGGVVSRVMEWLAGAETAPAPFLNSTNTVLEPSPE